MSEALRALADADEAQFDHPPGDTALTGDHQKTPAQEPPSEEPAEQAQPEDRPSAHEPAEDEPGKAKPKEKKLSKFELAQQREKRRTDQAYAKAAEARAEAEQIRAENQRLKQEAEAAKAQAKIDANPHLKQAINLLDQGFKPEDVDAEAKKLDEAFNQDGAASARAIAAQMRHEIDRRGKEGQAQQEQALAGRWKTVPFGTPEFDQSAMQLQMTGPDGKPNPEFDQCWAHVENNLIEAKKQSQDPLDRELAAQFRDTNSEFGKEMTKFLNTTAFGVAFKKYALGILPAYDLVKSEIRDRRQRALIAKYEKELESLRGATSLGSSAPANGNGNQSGTYGADLDEGGMPRDFANWPADKMRAFLRRREKL